jgi:DNA-binding NarL/FixJ family response regulator
MTVHARSANALTLKEIQIGILVRRCLRNRDIAELMQISEQDVKNRLRGIFDKVGVWSRVELAMHVVGLTFATETRTQAVAQFRQALSGDLRRPCRSGRNGTLQSGLRT